MTYVGLSLLVLLLLVAAVVAAVWWRRRAGARAAADLPIGATRPVVLVHGIMGFERIAGREYFRGITGHLRRAGVEVHTVRLGPLASVPDRAARLAAHVRSLPHPRVTLVAHSMGGLDARWAISRLGLHDRVAELITIGTPHRGSPIADLAACRPASLIRRVARRCGVRSDAVDWLTTERLARFNEEVPDVPGVAYFSVVARCSIAQLWRNPLLLACHLVVRRRGGENDGLVPCESQRWGEVLGEVDAHHWAQVGWSLRYRAAALYDGILRRLHGGADQRAYEASVPAKSAAIRSSAARASGESERAHPDRAASR